MIHASLDQGDKIKLLMMIFTGHTLLLTLLQETDMYIRCFAKLHPFEP